MLVWREDGQQSIGRGANGVEEVEDESLDEGGKN